MNSYIQFLNICKMTDLPAILNLNNEAILTHISLSSHMEIPSHFSFTFLYHLRNWILGATVILKYLISVTTKIILGLCIGISDFQWGIVEKSFIYFVVGKSILRFSVKKEIFPLKFFQLLARANWATVQTGNTFCDVMWFLWVLYVSVCHSGY